MAGCVAVLNAGSSSIKFAIYRAAALDLMFRGQIERIGTGPRLKVFDGDHKAVVERSWDGNALDHRGATEEIIRTVRQLIGDARISAVGHRVVHGGTDFAQPVRIDARVVETLAQLVPLAPLHQPHNLAPIRSLLANLPHLPQVACFDTAFHRSHPAVADHFAIPQQLYAEGVRRYGFHGLSYEYIASRLPEVAPQAATGRVIVAHLGSGASMCALLSGRSIESTMGFTALDGLPMGTRPGQIDPGVILYLFEQQKVGAHAVQDFLYRECGLKGLSGISNDVRELQSSKDPCARFALDYFCYRVGLHAGMLAAALAGLDALVFTAGIGENSASIRADIVAKLAWLGAALDAKANAAHALRISAPESRIALYVIPTDEELMIARHTLALLGSRTDQRLRQAAGE
jgi:acetate kinase